MRKSRPPGDEIELFLSWGEGAAAQVLAVAFVARGETFAIGEAAGCDALVPFEALRSARVEVALWRDEPILAPPPRSLVWVDGQPSPAEPTRLEPGQVLDATFGLFTVRARLVQAAPLSLPRPRIERAWGVALSAAAHFAVFAASSRTTPPPPSREITAERLFTMRQLLDASSARTPPPPPAPHRPARSASEDSFPSKRRAERDPVSTEHAPAATESPAGPTAKRAKAQGPASERDEASVFGAIALMKDALKVDPSAAESWDRAQASLERDAARGRAFYLDEDVGTIAGLKLSGGSQETGGAGTISGPEVQIFEVEQLTKQLREELAHPLPGGFAHVPNRRGGGGGGSMKRPPWEVIPDETIGRLVRANQGRFEACHNAGRVRNPNLAGTVNVAFTIDGTGRVTEAHDAGGELADDAVRACVVSAFLHLAFAPPPNRKDQRVTYPIVLGAPAGSAPER